MGLPKHLVFGTISALDESGATQEGDVPFRTIVMLISLITHILVSSLTHYLFVEEKISLKFDIFECYDVR